MNFNLVLKVVARIILVEAGALSLPMLVAYSYGESTLPFLLTIGLLLLFCIPLSFLPSKKEFFLREGFVTVGLLWLITGIVGGLPFYFSGYFPSFIDCVFESCSGFTTTGATILTDIEALPHGILFWRSFTHWLGGMGVLVLATAILPSFGIRSHYMTQAESPGPVFSKLVPKQSQTSKILYGIYCALTVIEAFILKILGMPLYDAVIHAFSTAGTGGFSNRNASVGAYGDPAIEMVIAVFAILFSVNFGLYFLLIRRRFREVLASDELRFFVGIVAGATLLITINTLPVYQTVLESFRYAFFQVASIISTTGFATADYVLWPQFSQGILILLMFCGACAGSTGGGIKCSRVLMLLRSIRRELHCITHPRSVEVVRLDGKVVEEKTMHSVLVFFCCYLLVILGATLIISLDGYSFSISFSSALTCISNVGPGLELVGPTGNFSTFSPLSKAVMALCMIVGRLEIFPILVLFSHLTWRRT